MGSIDIFIICMKKREIKSIFKVTWFLLPPLPASPNTVEEAEVRDHFSYYFMGGLRPSQATQVVNQRPELGIRNLGLDLGQLVL